MIAQVAALVILTMLAAVSPRPVEAGGEMDCREPAAFAGVAVNTAVLQYLYDGPAGNRRSVTAQRLSGLMHLDTLVALAKHGSIGVVHLVIPPGSESSCSPASVTAKLLGRQSGGQPVRPDHALVVVWGRMYEEQGEIYVQSRIEFRRRDRAEELRLSVADGAGQPVTFRAGLPSQTVVFPPRRLTPSDLVQIEANFAKASVVRTEPKDTAPGQRWDLGPDRRFTYWIRDTRPDGWMRIASSGRGAGPSGWIHARVDWGLRARMPELLLVDALVGYLRYRMDREGPRVPVSIQPPARVRQTLAQYMQLESGATATEPRALARSLDAVLQILETGPADRVTVPDSARTALAEVPMLVPDNPAAWTLKAVADVPACCGAGPATIGWDDVAKTFLNALAVAPRDRVALADLEALYALLSGSPPPAAAERADIARRLQEVRAVRSALGNP